MKIELDKKDINFINRINEDLSNGENVPIYINNIGKDYYLNFKCLDIAKANAFIMYFMHPNNTKEIEEKFGIQINSINYCDGDNKLSELKSYLREFLNKLDNI